MKQKSSPDDGILVARHPEAGTRLAADRTWLADERALMAWIRTATSPAIVVAAIVSVMGLVALASAMLGE